MMGVMFGIVVLKLKQNVWKHTAFFLDLEVEEFIHSVFVYNMVLKLIYIVNKSLNQIHIILHY